MLLPYSLSLRFSSLVRPWRGGLLVLALGSATIRSQAGDSSSLSSIADREVARRQTLVQKAGERLAEGIRLHREGKLSEACQVLLETYREIPDSPLASSTKEAVRQAYGAAATAYSTELLTKARYEEAHQVLDTVLAADMSPTHEAAKKLKRQASDPDLYPPASTPDHLDKVRRVNTLLELAASAGELHQHDNAIAAYMDVLRMDPYSIAARRGIETINREKERYYSSAYDQTRSKLLSQTSEQWVTAVPPSTDMTNAFALGRQSSGSVIRGRREQLAEKLRSLRLPKLELAGATLEEVVEYLRITSRDIDPDGKGVDFIVNSAPEVASKSLTLTLLDIPLEEAVRYVTELAGMSYKLDDAAVVITSLSDQSTQMISKTYRVPPDFIQAGDAGAAGSGPAAASDPFGAPRGATVGGIAIRRMGAKEFLEARGITFGPNASASFSPATSTLVIRNSAQNIALIDTLVEQSINKAPKQVNIAVKIIEVNETTLDEIGNDIAFGQGNVPGSDRLFASGGTSGGANAPPGTLSITEGLRSSGAIIGQPGIDQLLGLARGQEVPSIESRSPGAFQLYGALTDPQFSAVARLVGQKTGNNLMSMPSIVTRSGQKADIRIVREFPYPTEFDPPEIPQQITGSNATAINLLTGTVTTSGSGTPPIVPTTPTTFEVRELGTVLEVEPVISEDGRTIDLTLSPSNTEFEGFIDYGSDIRNSSDNRRFDLDLFAFVSSGNSSYIVDNPIPQPVFRKSGINTSVTVWDGNTVVLGGLMSEKVTDIQDKVPVIGDIPLIGRLWQSKVKQTNKKCVLMFVTVKIIDPGGQRINLPTADSAMGASPD